MKPCLFIYLFSVCVGKWLRKQLGVNVGKSNRILCWRTTSSYRYFSNDLLSKIIFLFAIGLIDLEKQLGVKLSKWSSRMTLNGWTNIIQEVGRESRDTPWILSSTIAESWPYNSDDKKNCIKMYFNCLSLYLVSCLYLIFLCHCILIVWIIEAKCISLKHSSF